LAIARLRQRDAPALQVAPRNRIRHLERRRIALAEAGDGEDGLSLLDNLGDGSDLHAEHARAEEDRGLHAAIERLPPLQRTILTLYHLEELPIGEIASITGLAEGTIKSHLFRSRNRLRELLAPRIGVAA
ncbi:MAG: sigma-70 family RNA polymerase sigma factor, partial [Lysobacteraceae bacterium]